MEKIDSELLSVIADLHTVPQGAYNIRKNGQLLSRNSSANIEIVPKHDKSGIDIKIADNTQNESVHIPVIITKTGIKDLVYNDFFVGENCNVTIVAGCGIHCGDAEPSEHSGIHRFFVGKNSTVRYVERHIGVGNGNGDKIFNPKTVVELAEGAVMEMQTTQLGGVTSTLRTTEATLDNNSKLDIVEKILTENTQRAKTEFLVNLNGDDSRVKVVSRSVAKGMSNQLFHSIINGNARCFGHVECDAIIMDKARVSSIPEISANNIDAALTHEAAIGKIAGEQIIKLMTLGLTAEEAENMIVHGFLR